MSNIKKINELRKLVKETEWLNLKWTKDEVKQGFNHYSHELKLKENRNHYNDFFLEKEDEKDVFIFNKRNLFSSINKKLKTTTWGLRVHQVKNNRYNDNYSLKRMLPKEIVDKLEKDNHTFSMLELRGAWTSYNQPHFTNMILYVNDFTDEIIFVKYDLKDVWFNNFFRNKLDLSITNNWDWLNSEKQFNLIYEQRKYKVVSVTALTNELAQKKAQEQMPELVWSEGRKNGDWNYIAPSKVETTPEGNFDVSEICDRNAVGVWH